MWYIYHKAHIELCPLKEVYLLSNASLVNWSSICKACIFTGESTFGSAAAFFSFNKDSAPETTKRLNLVTSACNFSFSTRNRRIAGFDFGMAEGGSANIDSSSLVSSELLADFGDDESRPTTKDLQSSRLLLDWYSMKSFITSKISLLESLVLF